MHNDPWQGNALAGDVSANPFAKIISQRAAFVDGGQRSEAGDGLAAARIDTYAPPYFQAPEKAQLKVGAPPSTLDFAAARLPGEPEVNAVGVLKARSSEVTPAKTVETAEKQFAQPARMPTLAGAEFPWLNKQAQGFDLSNYDLSMKPTPEGGMSKTLVYTKDNFETLRMTGKDDGTSSASISDPYGRKRYQEDIDARGGHTLTAYGYPEGKISPFPSTIDQLLPNGTSTQIVMDRGKQVSKTNFSNQFA